MKNVDLITLDRQSYQLKSEIDKTQQLAQALFFKIYFEKHFQFKLFSALWSLSSFENSEMISAPTDFKKVIKFLSAT